MSSHNVPRPISPHASMPLDVARSAFEWLVTGPQPVSVDGRLFPGLPARAVPLHEVRDRLLRRRCPQALRDAVWAHLVLRTRTDGATWTVGCVGVALPALTSVAATLSSRFAGDPSDVHAAVLAAFVAELGEIDLRKPRIMLRLRWAAYRGGHAAVREALDAPVPSSNAFRSTPPTQPWGHPDFVLARAVAERAITAAEAELIGSTRLDRTPLADAATHRGQSYEAAKKARQRAERRLVAYLLDDIRDSDTTGTHGRTEARDIATQVVEAVTITDAARRDPTTAPASHRVTRLRGASTHTKPEQVSPRGRNSGVQGCTTTPSTAPSTTASTALPPSPPTPSGQPPSTPDSSDTTPGASRCA